MKKFLVILLYYIVIPFAASVLGLILALFGLTSVAIAVVPVVAAAVYVLFRKKLDMLFAARVNGIIFLILLACFTVMMLISSGNVEGVLMTNFCWLIMPFAPVMIIYMLVGKNILLYLTALLTFAAATVTAMILGKIRIKKNVLVPALLTAACIIASVILYVNRPAVKYAGHGFAYMHGYSSTDFSDYMVYSEPSKLVQPDKPVSLVIEDEKDMPVMDGAEACYPLYAAFAKAVYKDIDVIEKTWLKEADNQYCNGKIVTFTNSVMGFARLLRDGTDAEKFGDSIDMFFGARPSASQLQEAEEFGVELEITTIGREAFVFFVEEDNPVSDLTSEQVRAIYHGDITNWSEVGGKDHSARLLKDITAAGFIVEVEE